MPNHQLIDPQGRKLSYLRVSVTDRCNFRCSYCYSNADTPLDEEELLKDDEIIKLIHVFVSLGINKVRLTGGEPLLRKNLVNLVEKIAAIHPIKLVGLTTNGYLLKPQLPSLIDAGLNRINISLDTLRRDVFKNLTSIDGLERVLNSIDAAERSETFPFVKVNMLLMNGFNDLEVNDFADWALSRKIDLRFIEFMPTQCADWEERKFISESDLRNLLKYELLHDYENEDINSPARSYRVEGYPGRISFISAMSRSFCKSCSRLRLTSDGRLLGCLFGKRDIDLKPLLVNNKSINEIADYVKKMISTDGFRQIPSEKGAAYQPAMKSIGG